MADGRGWWHWATSSDGARVDLPRLGELLRDYRAANDLTQTELAALLAVDQSYVSKIERGRRQIRDLGFLLQVAHVLGLAPNQLGLSNELARSLTRRGQPADVRAEPRLASDDPILANQDRWRSERRYLNKHRHDLAVVAADMYQGDLRIDRTPLIAPRAWLPSEPIDLDDVELSWREDRSPLGITGGEPESHAVRPPRAAGQHYDLYTSAIRYLDPPALLENRPSYRLLEVEWSAHGGRMTFGIATYFDKLDVSEAVGHELAAARLAARHDAIGWRQLPFRSLIGDPFDLRRRAVIPAITTLMLRRSRTHGTATFLLHWRDPERVATAAGLYDVIPAGEFQPSSIAPWDQDNDFDVWCNIVREASEELLGAPEHDGSQSTPIDYDGWPLFRSLTQARREGRLTVSCLGVGLDALTLAATILTVVVINDDVFDQVFGEAVRVNAEGVVVFDEPGGTSMRGIPFNQSNVTRLLEAEPMASPGAACLALAWQHRIALMTGHHQRR